MTLLSVLAASLPMLAYVLLIAWLTRYDRPPLWLGALVVIWGAAGASTLAYFSELRVATWLQGAPEALALQTIVAAPVIEESLKGVIFLPLLASGRLRSMSNASIYGAVCGLGFAMTENLLSYTTLYERVGLQAWLANVAVRTLFTTVMHSCATATFGAFVARFRHHVEFHRWITGPILGLLSAVLIHSGYNGGLVAGAYGGGYDTTLLLLAPLLLLVLYVTTQLSLVTEQRLVRIALQYEAREHETLPLEHADIIASVVARRRDDWLPPSADRERYIQAALGLAIELHRQRHLEGDDVDAAEDELDRLRALIQESLAAVS